ncbi:MAG: hypothetical protein N3B21_19490 [Clostridia bacterium]|nr:hypothetical protein [Clostridia bacterium]
MDDIYSKQPKFSCYGCTKRVLGCHSTCAEYLAAKEARTKANTNQQKSQENYTTAMTKRRYYELKHMKR